LPEDLSTRDLDLIVRVLFFGRSDCEFTERAFHHLQKLGCETTFIKSSKRGAVLPGVVDDWEGEFIFCFRSMFVLPKKLLIKAMIGAVNFHPAPVEYPGSGCLNFALYENASQYGVTAHVMNEKIDSGPILECRRFPLLKTDTVSTLLKKTHLELLDLFLDVASDLVRGGSSALAKKASDSSGERWRGEATKIKDLELLRIVPIDVSEDELLRVIRATHTENFPTLINLHGFEFVLKAPHKSAGEV
jgi:methionyl-tRNA formyltransferase